jgi:hypothetical protein
LKITPARLLLRWAAVRVRRRLCHAAWPAAWSGGAGLFAKTWARGRRRHVQLSRPASGSSASSGSAPCRGRSGDWRRVGSGGGPHSGPEPSLTRRPLGRWAGELEPAQTSWQLVACSKQRPRRAREPWRERHARQPPRARLAADMSGMLLLTQPGHGASKNLPSSSGSIIPAERAHEAPVGPERMVRLMAHEWCLRASIPGSPACVPASIRQQRH